MNSYWQVLRTYLWRPRFWVLTILYLLIVWVWFWFIVWNEQLNARDLLDNALAQSIASAVFTSLTGCFLALHVRRQFTTAAAHVVPGYVTPHLVAAGLVSSLLWLIVPAIAVVAGHWTSGALALHAMAAILMVIVVCWPRGILLLTVVPVLVVWANRQMPRGQTQLLVELAHGNRPLLTTSLVAIAAVGQLVAAWFLFRAPRQGTATNDEFTLDKAASSQDLNPLSRWMLNARDAAGQRLMEARGFASIQRWRVPVATSLVQYSLPFVIVLVACGVGWTLGNADEWGIIAVAVTSAVLLLVPLAPWHFRRKTMGQELLLPVSRERYFRDVTVAMGFDVIIWTAISSALIISCFLVALVREPDSFHDFRRWLPSFANFLWVLWTMAVFVFGVGISTIRWQLWLPLVATIAVLWLFGGMMLAFSIGRLIRFTTPWRYPEGCMIALFFVLTFLCGVMLLRSTHRRWLDSDVA
jgi:hypothetical protein